MHGMKIGSIIFTNIALFCDLLRDQQQLVIRGITSEAVDAVVILLRAIKLELNTDLPVAKPQDSFKHETARVSWTRGPGVDNRRTAAAWRQTAAKILPSFLF